MASLLEGQEFSASQMQEFYFELHTPEGVDRDEFPIWFQTAEEAFVEAKRAIPVIAELRLSRGLDPAPCKFVFRNAKGESYSLNFGHHI